MGMHAAPPVPVTGKRQAEAAHNFDHSRAGERLCREQFILERKMNLVIRVARTNDFTERISPMITAGAYTCQVNAPGDATYS